MEERDIDEIATTSEIQEKKPATDFKAVMFDWVKTIVLAIVLALFVRTTIVGAYFVPTGSMKPTIGIGDRLLGVKFLYWFTEPERGDIVVFEPPPAAHSDVPRYVKRVVAVEGDIVEVNHGILYVNGEPVNEPYASPPLYHMSAKAVPDASLFVLGDNRNNSADGHVWGFLPKENVEAKIVFRFWPLTRAGTLAK